MSLSAAQKLALLPEHLRRRWLSEQSRDTLAEILAGAWWWVGRPEQFAPPGDWLVWLIQSGRGWGKTRTGAEWLIDKVFTHPVDAFGQRTEWLVIAETLNDCRVMCIEGSSGILSVLTRIGLIKNKDYRYLKSPKLMIEFKSGQVIYFEGADNADVGRGYNASGAWLDELAKWKYTYAAWYEGILPSLRAPLIGDHPRAVVTTTPKPIKLLLEWRHTDDGTVTVTQGATFDNRANLSPLVLAKLEDIYRGTRAGQQELYGVLLEEIEGALWFRDKIENDRVDAVPPLKTIVIGMDPGATGAGDETGLIAAGRSYGGEDYVLADWSAKIVGMPAARRAWEMFLRYDATWLIVETNYGKKWLTTVLTDAYKAMQAEGLFGQGPPPIRDVTSLAGKRLRAEPVAARYEQGRWHHVGTFTELEDQMVTWVPEESPGSPDRIDALVQAGLYLMGGERNLVRVAVPGATSLSGMSLDPSLAAPLMPAANPYG